MFTPSSGPGDERSLELLQHIKDNNDIALVHDEKAREAQSVRTAEERLQKREQENIANTKGIWPIRKFKQIVKGAWQDFRHDRNRQKELEKVRHEMDSGGTLYLDNEPNGKEATQQSMEDMADRMTSQYVDETIHAGEKRVELNDPVFKTKLQKIIKDYAAGTLGDRAALDRELHTTVESHNFDGVISGLGADAEMAKQVVDAVKSGVLGSGSNFYKVAESARAYFKHAKTLDGLDSALDMKIYAAKVRMQASETYERSGMDSVIEKIRSNKIGQLVDERVIAAAVTTAAGLWKPLKRAMTGRVAAAVTVGASAMLAGGFAAAKEKKRMNEELEMVDRAEAAGADVRTGAKGLRKDLVKELYEKRGVEYYSNFLEHLIFKTENGKRVLKDISELNPTTELPALKQMLGEIDARVQVTEAVRAKGERVKRVFKFEGLALQERGRKQLDILRGQAKAILKAPGGAVSIGHTNDIIFARNTHLNELNTEHTKKDQAYHSLQAKRMSAAFAKGSISSLVIGAVAQEAIAQFSDTYHYAAGTATSRGDTVLEHLTGKGRWYQNQGLGKTIFEKAGYSNPLESTTNSSVQVHTTGSYAEGLGGQSFNGKFEGYLDNNSTRFDLNELQLKLHELKGDHLEFDISKVTKGGSFHGKFHPDIRDALSHGRLGVIINVDGEHILGKLDSNGHVSFDGPMVSKIAHMSDGHLSLGAENAQMILLNEANNFSSSYKVMATFDGSDTVHGLTTTTVESSVAASVDSGDTTLNHDVEGYWALPANARKGMDMPQNTRGKEYTPEAQKVGIAALTKGEIARNPALLASLSADQRARIDELFRDKTIQISSDFRDSLSDAELAQKDNLVQFLSLLNPAKFRTEGVKIRIVPGGEVNFNSGEKVLSIPLTATVEQMKEGLLKSLSAEYLREGQIMAFTMADLKITNADLQRVKLTHVDAQKLFDKKILVADLPFYNVVKAVAATYKNNFLDLITKLIPDKLDGKQIEIANGVTTPHAKLSPDGNKLTIPSNLSLDQMVAEIKAAFGDEAVKSESKDKTTETGQFKTEELKDKIKKLGRKGEKEAGDLAAIYQEIILPDKKLSPAKQRMAMENAVGALLRFDADALEGKKIIFEATRIGVDTSVADTMKVSYNISTVRLITEIEAWQPLTANAEVKAYEAGDFKDSDIPKADIESAFHIMPGSDRDFVKKLDEVQSYIHIDTSITSTSTNARIREAILEKIGLLDVKKLQERPIRFYDSSVGKPIDDAGDYLYVDVKGLTSARAIGDKIGASARVAKIDLYPKGRDIVPEGSKDYTESVVDRRYKIEKPAYVSVNAGPKTGRGRRILAVMDRIKAAEGHDNSKNKQVGNELFKLASVINTGSKLGSVELRLTSGKTRYFTDGTNEYVYLNKTENAEEWRNEIESFPGFVDCFYEPVPEGYKKLANYDRNKATIIGALETPSPGIGMSNADANAAWGAMTLENGGQVPFIFYPDYRMPPADIDDIAGIIHDNYTKPRVTTGDIVLLYNIDPSKNYGPDVI